MWATWTRSRSNTGFHELLLAHLSFWLLAAFPLVKCAGNLALCRATDSEMGSTHLYLQIFLSRVIRHGVPLWNPLTMCGYPAAGDLRLGAFHPISLLHFLFGPIWAVNVATCVASALGASMMYGCARHFGISRFGAWISGLCYGFSGYLVGHGIITGDYTVVLAYPWVPASVWALSSVWRRRDLGSVAAAALAWATLIVSGNIPMLLMTLLVFCIVALGVFPLRDLIRGSLHGIAAALLTIALSLPFLYLSLHWLRQSALRVPVESIYSFPYDRLLPEHLLMLIFPHILGDEVNSIFWGRLSYSACLGYIGLLPLLLSILPACKLTSKGVGRVFFFGSVIGLFLGGGYPPLFQWAAGLPGWVQAIQGPAQFVFLFVLFASLGAGIGWDQFDSWPASRKKRRAIGAAVFCAVGALILWAIFVRKGSSYLWTELIARMLNHPFSALPVQLRSQMAGNANFATITFMKARDAVVWAFGLLAAGSALAYWGWKCDGVARRATHTLFVLLLISDLPVFLESMTSVSSSALNAPASVANTVKAGTSPEFRSHAPLDPPYELWSIAFTRPALWGSTRFMDRRLSELARIHERQALGYQSDIRFSRLSPLADFLGERVILSRPDFMLKDQRLTETLTAKDVRIYENRQAMPRASFIPNPQFGVSDRAALLATTAEDFQPTRTVYIAEPNPGSLNIEGLASPNPPMLIKEDTRQSVWKFDKATTGLSVLVVSDVFDPWWRAFADGREMPIARANYAFRAVLLPEGTQSLRFEYCPPLFRPLLFLAGTALALCLLALTTGGWRRKIGDGS